MRIAEEGTVTKDSLLNFFIGEHLGSGAYRRVYALRNEDIDSVVKIEFCDTEFCNITEWKVWKAVEKTPLEDWFAPCVGIDMLGLALFQRRTEPFYSEKKFKEAVEALAGGKLPSFFDDIHYGNFGMFEGRIVCHDYGFNHFLDEAVKMKWENLYNPDVQSDTAPPEENQLAFTF